MNSFLQVDPRALSAARPPVLLLGGLNLVRAFGLARIPVIVASPHAFTPAMASRYATGRCELPPLAQREAVVERLLRAGEELTRRVGTRIPLFYGDDDYLGLVGDFRSALGARFLLLLNDAPLTRALHNKALFQALGERRGLPVPRRLDWDTLESFEAPVLAKPHVKTSWENAPVYTKLFGSAGKARIFSSGRAARQNTLVQRLAGDLGFQEYVPGDDRSLWSFHGFADERSELLASFIGRKIRTYPALTGDSSYLELAHDDDLAAVGADIVERLRLKGLFKIDFKRHAETGRFYVLEVNARSNLWHYLGAKNGVNLAEVAYEYLTRGTRPQSRISHTQARTDYRWLAFELDYRAYRESNLGFARWLGSLLASRKVYDVFAWDDPLPFVFRLRELAQSLLPRLRRRMLRWLSTAS